jgi:hypothetical protein
MIDDHLLKEDEIDDQVRVARVMQKLLDSALGFPEKPWQDWDASVLPWQPNSSSGVAFAASRRDRRRSRPRYSSNPRVKPSLVHKKARSMSGPNRLVERLTISSPCPRRVAWRAWASPF